MSKAANGAAAGSHAHNDGSSGRAFTPDQKAAVTRVRRCKTTAFYDILGIEAERATVGEAGVKKAYRKLSLLTHPDKNGCDGADEAFKMVSRAFQILSDPEKKRQYDQFGTDPDVRGGGGGGGGGGSPFSSFSRGGGGFPGARGGGMFDEEISPEDLFRQFFGGGGGLGGPFGGGGPGFVFNMGGGPGIRVHQFGGATPRRRGATARAGADSPQTPLSALQNLLPLLLLFLIPLLSSLFSGLGSSDSLPRFELDVPSPPLTHLHTSARLGVPYYVEPVVAHEMTARGRWGALDRAAESLLVGRLSRGCQAEHETRERLMREAQGWFSVDREKYDQARGMEMRSCGRLNAMGYKYQ